MSSEMDVSDPANYSLPKLCSQSSQCQEYEEQRASLVGTTLQSSRSYTVHGLHSAVQSSSWESQFGLVLAVSTDLSVQGVFSKIDQPLPGNLACKVCLTAAHSHVEPPTLTIFNNSWSGWSCSTFFSSGICILVCKDCLCSTSQNI
jgi:hypothetical protein